MLLESTLFSSSIYFSTILRSDETAILLVITTIFLLLEYINLTEISHLMFLNCLLMLAICIFDCAIILSTLSNLIDMIICFLDRVTFSYHVYFWFIFLAWFAYDIVDFRYLIESVFREDILDLEYFLDIAPRYLSIWLFVILWVWVN